MSFSVRENGDRMEIVDEDGNVVAHNQMTIEEAEAVLPTLSGEAAYLMSHVVKKRCGARPAAGRDHAASAAPLTTISLPSGSTSSPIASTITRSCWPSSAGGKAGNARSAHHSR